METLTLEQRSLLLEYIKSYELLNVVNDSMVYNALQDRMPRIAKRLSFDDNESQLTVYNFAQSTLERFG